MKRSLKWWLFLGIGFYFCGILTIIPLPSTLTWYRPHWLLMFCIFCQIGSPRTFNPLMAWVGGLLLDCLFGTPLGENALVLAVICYLTGISRYRFLQRPLWQQMGKIFLLVFLGQVIIYGFHALAGQNPQTLLYWMGTITSCLFWPLFVRFLQYLTHLLNIAPFSSRSI